MGCLPLKTLGATCLQETGGDGRRLLAEDDGADGNGNSTNGTNTTSEQTAALVDASGNIVSMGMLTDTSGAIVSPDGTTAATPPLKFETDTAEIGGLAAFFDLSAKERNSIESLTITDGEFEVCVALPLGRCVQLKGIVLPRLHISPPATTLPTDFLSVKYKLLSAASDIMTLTDNILYIPPNPAYDQKMPRQKLGSYWVHDGVCPTALELRRCIAFYSNGVIESRALQRSGAVVCTRMDTIGILQSGVFFWNPILFVKDRP